MRPGAAADQRRARPGFGPAVADDAGDDEVALSKAAPAYTSA